MSDSYLLLKLEGTFRLSSFDVYNAQIIKHIQISNVTSRNSVQSYATVADPAMGGQGGRPPPH